MPKILPLLVLQFVSQLLFLSSVTAQTNVAGTNSNKNPLLDNLTPQVVTPNAATFQAVNLSNVNTYVGTADINVPIHTIRVGSMTIPISLSYLTSGIKANQVSSNVGQNWTLNAGGSITKVVKGYEDFTATFYEPFKKNVPTSQLATYTDLCSAGQKDHALKKIGWLLQDAPFSRKEYLDLSSSCSDLVHSAREIQNSFQIKRDNYPDLFIASAPGISTRFTHRLDRSVLEIEKQGNIITTSIGKSPVVNLFPNFNNSAFSGFAGPYDGGPSRRLICINNIEITNLSGIKYTFKDLDINQHVNRDGLRSFPNPKEAEVQLTSQEVSNYNLSTMEDTEGNSVSFVYEKYALAEPEFSKSFVHKSEGDDKFRVASLTSTEVRYPQLQRLKEISYRSGSVKFYYDLNRRDLVGDKALTKITIEDYNGKLIRQVDLKYDYFISNNDCRAATCKRLRLDQVIVKGRDGISMPPYRFFYNATRLPERGSRYVDFMGYANGPVPSEFAGQSVIANTETTFVPAPILYFTPYEKRLAFSPFPIFKDTYETKGFVSLKPSLPYTAAGILERMITPTGAIKEYGYELNTFRVAEEEDVAGGGLRIRQQKVIDDKGKEQITRYHYLEEDGKSSGYINNLPLYGVAQAFGDGYSVTSPKGVPLALRTNKIALNLFSTPRANIELTNGSAIGYSRVLIEENNNGYREELYTSPKEYPLEEPAFFPSIGGGLEREIEYSYNNGGFFPHFNDRDILLGKLTSRKYFDNDDVLQREELFAHDYKRFETMVQTIQIPKSDVVAFIRPEEDYYLEFKSIVYSHRNLNFSKIEKMTFEGGEVSSTMQYTFDPLYPLPLQRFMQNSQKDKVTVHRYTYPYQASQLEGLSTIDRGGYSALTFQNRISEPIEEEVIVTKGQNPSSSTRKRTTYRETGENIQMYGVYTALGTDALEERVTVDRYDPYGNPLSITKASDEPTSFIWGYKSSLILARLENVAYSDISPQIIQNLQRLSDGDNDTCQEGYCKEADLRAALAALRTTFADSQVTTYTHDPMLGVTSITDPTGYTSYYNYEGLNRVESIKDQDAYILSAYNYNFKKQ